MSLKTALMALAGAVVLAVLFYFVIGFPANVPAAVGTAVLIAELAARSSHDRPQGIGRTIVHAVLAAFASWLGVVLVRMVGIG